MRNKIKEEFNSMFQGQTQRKSSEKTIDVYESVMNGVESNRTKQDDHNTNMMIIETRIAETLPEGFVPLQDKVVLFNSNGKTFLAENSGWNQDKKRYRLIGGSQSINAKWNEVERVSGIVTDIIVPQTVQVNETKYTQGNAVTESIVSFINKNIEGVSFAESLFDNSNKARYIVSNTFSKPEKLSRAIERINNTINKKFHYAVESIQLGIMSDSFDPNTGDFTIQKIIMVR